MNLPDRFADTYFVLDFDRCIGNTEKARQLLWSVVESETGIRTDELSTAKQNTDTKGYTFDTVDYVTKELLRTKSNVSWQEIRQVFVAVARQQNLLEPAADMLLDLLDEHKIPYGVLTYGREPWQLTKLEAAGLIARGVPFEITQIEYKGKILTGWKHDDVFVIPPAMTRDFASLQVRNIVFLDDKPRSFIGLPAGVHGVCVRSVVYSPLPSQQGELPAGVDEVKGIQGAIKLLF